TRLVRLGGRFLTVVEVEFPESELQLEKLLLVDQPEKKIEKVALYACHVKIIGYSWQSSCHVWNIFRISTLFFNRICMKMIAAVTGRREAATITLHPSRMTPSS